MPDRFLLDLLGTARCWILRDAVDSVAARDPGRRLSANDLVTAVYAAQAGQVWAEDLRRHWHGQLPGAHTSVLDTQRALLQRLSIAPATRAPLPDGG